jgi:hypothetical protein
MNAAQKHDGHDLTARNYRHWIAVSANENGAALAAGMEL